MADLYRVFPYVISSRATQPGGPLYIPPQRAGRIDNPDLYSVLYLSDQAPGAIAEASVRFPEWTPAILQGNPDLPGSSRAIARYRLPAEVTVCNLDDAEQLGALGLR